MGVKKMTPTLESILTELYKHEINCSINSEWDAGWTIRLGDEMNGYKESIYIEGEEVNLIGSTLIAMVGKQYPHIKLFENIQIVSK
jgi:hypothetical protein